MRFQNFILPFVFAGIACAAEPKHDHDHDHDDGKPAAGEDASPREAALERLLSERTSAETFATAVADAKKQGISDQAILEATFIFHVDRHEDDKIAALLPDFEKQSETFKVENSEIFATKEDWLAVLEYVRAIKALQGGDKAEFKKHITEAFWLSPKQGSAFAPHIDRLRMAETMAAVKIDFTTPFRPLYGDEAVPLSKVIGDKKALLLQFWSPWSNDCEMFLPDFATITKELDKNQIAVASIILEDSSKALSDARDLLKPIDPKPGTWLLDQEKTPLSPVLRIQNVPIFVLISPAGGVLYNGPADAGELWDALKKINPSINKPELSSEQEDH